MSVIIRLQNLPWSANALDIRQYFHGLSIPEGGVHIVGGEQGDAFIAFSTDEDARQAFERNNGKIKEIQIKLMLSSRTEMQKVIETARNQTMAAYLQPVQPLPTPVPAMIPAAIPPVGQVVRKDEKKEDSDSKDKSDKKDRRRSSRSWSRDRSDRSKDRDRDKDKRDRKRRDRSRSRSRDRRDRRRRDRSSSRERRRSRDRDHRTSRERRRSDDKSTLKDDKGILPWQNDSSNGSSSFGFNNPLTNFDKHNSIPNASIPFPNKMDNFSNNWQNNSESDTSQNSRWGFNNRFGQDQRSFNNFEDRFNNKSWSKDGGPFEGKNDRFKQRTIQKNTCVRLYPFFGGFSEVRRFFQGLFIHCAGIKLINDKTGRRTGVTYIQFVHPNEKQIALEKNQCLLRGQPVEVVHLEDEEFEKEVDRFRPTFNQWPTTEIVIDDDEEEGDVNSNESNPQEFTCLVLEDLPTYIKEQDILKIFSDYSLLSISIVGKQRKNKVAYVKFSLAEHAQKALEDRSRHKVDGKRISVKSCCDQEFEEATKHQADSIESQSPKRRAKVDSECVCLTGLPSSVNERDIADFFCDVGTTPEKIHLISKSKGFTGEALCRFESIEEAESAVTKDGMYLGTDIISVKSISLEEFENKLGIKSSKVHVEDENYPNQYDSGFNESNQSIMNQLGTKPLNMNQSGKNNSDMNRSNLNDMNRPSLNDMNRQNLNDMNRPNDMNRSNPNDMNRSNLNDMNRPNINNFDMIRSNMNYSELNRMNQNNHTNFNQPNQFNNQFGNYSNQFGMNQSGLNLLNQSLPLSNLFNSIQRPYMRNNNFNMNSRNNNFNRSRFQPPPNSESCTVLMENVPYKASVDELLAFFADFNVTADNILRRFNANGQPTGETKVMFDNTEDAHKAVQMKNREKIRDRVIYLSLC